MNNERFNFPEGSTDDERAVKAVLETIRELANDHLRPETAGLAIYGWQNMKLGLLGVSVETGLKTPTDLTFTTLRINGTNITTPRLAVHTGAVFGTISGNKSALERDVLRTLFLHYLYRVRPMKLAAPLSELYSSAIRITVDLMGVNKKQGNSEQHAFDVLGQERFISGYGYTEWNGVITSFASLSRLPPDHPMVVYLRDLNTFLIARQELVPEAYKMLFEKLGMNYLNMDPLQRYQSAALAALALFMETNAHGNN